MDMSKDFCTVQTVYRYLQHISAESLPLSLSGYGYVLHVSSIFMNLSESVTWTGGRPPRIWLCQLSAFAESLMRCQSEKFQGSWKALQGCQLISSVDSRWLERVAAFLRNNASDTSQLIRSSWTSITYYEAFYFPDRTDLHERKRHQVLLQNYSRLHLPHVRRRLEHRLKDLPGYQMCRPLTPQHLGPQDHTPCWFSFNWRVHDICIHLLRSQQKDALLRDVQQVQHWADVVCWC